MRLLAGCVCSFALFVTGGWAQDAPNAASYAGLRFAKTPSLPNYGKLSLSFEPNCGQADNSTLYLALGDGYLLSLQSSGLEILLRRADQAATIRTHLLGASQAPRMEGLDILPGRSSYFRGSDPSKWVSGVPNFARVRATGVYPGIDLIYYGNQTRLEYDFVVSTGADPQKIRMRFDGITSLRTDRDGNLVLSTAAGNLTQEKPVIYQMVDGVRRAIHGRFEVGARKTVAFRIDSYDHSLPLVIDPVLNYSSFLGGGNSDYGQAVAVDANGYLYLTGTTFSTAHGDADVLIRKIATDGSGFLYNADIGGSDDDFGNGIAVDPNGAVYVAGATFSQDFPLSNPAQDTNSTSGDSSVAFVLRLDPTGTKLMFSTYWGGSDGSGDPAYAIALDNRGSVYIAGVATSDDFPTSKGVFQSNIVGYGNCFVAKFDSQGNEVFSTLVGGRSNDAAFSIAVDGQGNSYITGKTDSGNYPQAHPPFQHSLHGGVDAFLTEISPDGSSLVFSTFAGGSNDDAGWGIALDGNRNAYVVGSTSSSDFPTTSGAYQRGYAGGNSDIFVLAYSANGKDMPKSLLFSTLLGSRGADHGYGIALDASNNIYVIGDTDSSQYPVTPAAIQPNNGGGLDVVISKLDATGSHLLYSTFLGGSRDDSGRGIALDVKGNVYLTGVTSSSDFPVTQDTSQSMLGGSWDAFFAQIGFSDSSDANCAPASAFLLAPASADLDVGGTGAGSGSFSVTTACSNWIAAPTVPWISVIGGSPGSGDGTVSFQVGQNTGTTARTGRVKVGPATFTVNQAAAAQATIGTVAGDGSRGFSGDDGPAVLAQLNNPGGVAVDSAGNLYVADTDNHRIRKISPAGIISTVAGTGTPGFSGDGGPAAMAEIFSPAAVATDATGNLYFTDTSNNRIRRVTPSGTISTVAGNGDSTFSGDGGLASAAALWGPNSIAVDSTGNLYINDAHNQRIREVTTDGIIRTIAGDGTGGFGGDGGPATSAQLFFPVGVAVDGAGNVYIADSSNHRVRKVTPTGIISTVAGTGQSGIQGDNGPAVSAQLWAPMGVALDRQGNLYIADTFNQRIREVTPDGVIHTVVGVGVSGGFISGAFGGDGGPATAAQLNYPSALALDDQGNLFIADTDNQRIRRVGF